MLIVNMLWLKNIWQTIKIYLIFINIKLYGKKHKNRHFYSHAFWIIYYEL